MRHHGRLNANFGYLSQIFFFSPRLGDNCFPFVSQTNDVNLFIALRLVIVYRFFILSDAKHERMILALLNRARKPFRKIKRNAVKIHLTKNVINDVAIKMANLNHRSLHLRIYIVVITKMKTFATNVYTSGTCLNVAFNKKPETIFSVNDNTEKIFEDFSSTQSIPQSFFYETSCIPQYCLRKTTFSFDGTSIHQSLHRRTCYAMIYFPFKCI